MFVEPLPVPFPVEVLVVVDGVVVGVVELVLFDPFFAITIELIKFTAKILATFSSYLFIPTRDLTFIADAY